MPIYNSAQPGAANAYEERRRAEAAGVPAFSPSPEEGQPEGQPPTEPTAPERPAIEMRRFRINLPLLLGSLFIGALIMAIVRVLLFEQPDLTTVDKLQLLIEIPPPTPGEGALSDILPNAGIEGDLGAILGPLLAVAISIERMIEAAFDWYERTTTAVADILIKPREALNWIEEEYVRAYEATAIAADQVRVEVNPGQLQRLEFAEGRLAVAEARLRSWTSASEYVAFKRALSIYIGLVAGLVVAIWGGVSFFQTLDLRAPLLLDMLITGLFIGIGPGPAHSVIGILQGANDSLKNLSSLLSARSVQEAVETVQKEIAVDVVPTEPKPQTPQGDVTPQATGAPQVDMTVIRD